MSLTAPDVIQSQTLVDAPNFTGVIDNRYFLEPLGGANHPYTYLDRFPESVYNLNPLGHLVKFLYAFLGPSGVASARQNYLQVRLFFQEHGFDFFQLDQFYGNPFQFGRLLEEQYNYDPTGLITQQQWDKIKAADSSYRNRAIDFMNAARAGNSPLGIQLAARSGLGHEVEVIENYRYLYDQHSDAPIGVPYQGATLSTEEVIILPRQDISQSETQTVGIFPPPAGGFFTLSFDGQETQPIAPTATRLDIQEFLEALPNIGKGNVIVTGGPGPNVPWEISFTGALGGRSLPQVIFNSSLLTMQETPIGTVDTTVGGVEASDEAVEIAPRNQRYMMDALNKVKAMTQITTFNQGSGLRSRTLWKNVTPSSEFTEVIRFVTGTTNLGVTSWIQAQIENQAPTSSTNRKHHYEGFHIVQRAMAYTDDALNDPGYETARFIDPTKYLYDVNPYNSEHFGWFLPQQERLFPFFKDPRYQYTAFLAQYVAQYVPYPTFDFILPNGTAVVNDWYPAEVYDQLFKHTRSPDYLFWASHERATGTDYLELDLGAPQAVNYLSFETTHKPFKVEIAYDVLDDPTGRRQFFPVSPSTTDLFEDNVTYSTDVAHPWQLVEYNFSNNRNNMIYTRFLRISFTRTTTASPYVDANGNPTPYSIDVRNLRIGRSVFIGDDRPYPPVVEVLGPPDAHVGPKPAKNYSQTKTLTQGASATLAHTP